MSKDATSFYRTLLSAAEPSPEVQRRAYAYSKLRDVDAIQIDLASLVNLVSDVDEAIGKTTSPRVLAAWAGRPGRSKEAINSLAKSSKSISVLKCLAARSDLDDEAYQHMLSVKSATVAAELARNSSLPYDVRLSAVRQLGSKLTHSRAKDVANILATEEKFMEEFAFNAPLTNAAFEVFRRASVLPENVQSYLFTKIVESWEWSAGSTDVSSPDFFWSYGLEILSYRDDLCSTKAADILNKPGVLQTLNPYQVRRLQAARDEGNSVTEAHNAIRGASSSAELDALIPLVIKMNSRPLATAVAFNPHVTKEQMLTVSKYWSYNTAFELIRHFSRDPERLVTILQARPYYISDSVLAKSGKPVEVLTELIRLFSDAGRAIPSGVASSKYLSKEMVLMMPTRFFLKEDIPEMSKVVIAELLDATFGSDAAAWDTFEGLLQGQEGTIGSLVDIVSSLCELPERKTQEVETLPVKKEKVKKTKESVDLLGEPLF